MMSELFLSVVRLSLSASLVVLAVLALRLVLRRAPRWLVCALWALVAVRLLCPFSPESRLSLMPEAVGSGALVERWADGSAGGADVLHDHTPSSGAAVSAGQPELPAGGAEHPAVTVPDRADTPSTVRNTVVPALARLWLAGVLLMALYTLASYLRLRRQVSDAVPLRARVYCSAAVPSPFVLGLFRPAVYLPAFLPEADAELVIAHEEAHLARRDHWWKPLGFALLSVYWFNPLLWLAYILLCRDIELACDERVVQDLEPARRADYSQALLDCAVSRRAVSACPLAFGETDVKRRVKRALNYRKPAFWLVAAAAVLAVTAAVCLLTNPRRASGGDYAIEGRRWALSLVMDGETVTACGRELRETYPDAKWVWAEAAAQDGVLTVRNVEAQMLSPQSPAPEGPGYTYELRYTLDEARPNAAVYSVTFTNGDGTVSAGKATVSDTGYVGGETVKTLVLGFEGGRLLQFTDAEALSRLSAEPVQPEPGSEPGGDPELWFDYLTQPLPEERSLYKDTGEFPGTTFHWTFDAVTAEREGAAEVLIQGMPVWNCFLADLNGDGYRELCATVSFGSGMIDERVIVYDYAAGKSCELSDRGRYDYTLTLRGGQLTAEQSIYGTAPAARQAVASGPLELTPEGTLRIGQDAGAEWSLSGTVLRWRGREYDLAEYDENINAAVGCELAGPRLVVEGHVGPKNAVYCVFDTERAAFVKKIAGTNLIWRGDDLTTAVYTFWNGVYAYDGTLLCELALEDGAYIGGLAFTDDPAVLRAEIVDGGGRETAVDIRPGMTPGLVRYTEMRRAPVPVSEVYALPEGRAVRTLPTRPADVNNLRPADFWEDQLVPLAHDAGTGFTLYAAARPVALAAAKAEGGRPPDLNAALDANRLVVRCGDRLAACAISWDAWFAGNPELYVGDFNGDGAPEAAVCVNQGHGTGVNVYELCIFDLTTLECRTPDLSGLGLALSFDDAAGTALLTAGDLSLTVRPAPEDLPRHAADYGNIVCFACEDGQLLCRLALDFSGHTTGCLADLETFIVWADGQYRLGGVKRLCDANDFAIFG